MAEMIATLSDACEREFGFLATRLFRVFKTEETQGICKLNRCPPHPYFARYSREAHFYQPHPLASIHAYEKPQKKKPKNVVDKLLSLEK